jgi:hypothetical protein
MVVSGEVVLTAGADDDTAFFNYTNYEHNALRMMRLGMSAVYRPAHWVAFVGEIRSEDLEHPLPYAAYVRVHPWRNHEFDVQAGRIPPAFGAFGRRGYGNDNTVIGYPLAYQYLTSLRADAIPATADELLTMRGRGWLANYSVGSPEPGPGLPLVSAFEWDTGVQARWRRGPVQIIGALTNGTLSNPRVSDDNGGKQVSGRVAVTPVVGLVLGASAARGAWLSRTVTSAGVEPQQRALGADIEYSRDHWIVRGEMVWSRFGFPAPLLPTSDTAVSARGAWAEGRYRVTPRIFVAGRADRLSFSKLQGSAPGSAPLQWDAPVERVEGSLGYYVQRNLVLRGTVQHNWRDGGFVTRRGYLSGQLAYWF